MTATPPIHHEPVSACTLSAPVHRVSAADDHPALLGRIYARRTDPRLERQVAALSGHDAGAPLARIANLEGIANAHTAQLKDLDRKVYRLRVDQADLDWRTTTNRWDLDRG